MESNNTQLNSSKFSFNPSLDPKDKSQSPTYFCEFCKEAPSVKIEAEDKIFVNVQCKCKEGKKAKTYDLGKYCQMIDKPPKLPFCDIKEQHRDPYPADMFCTICGKFLCINCIKDHDKFNSSHPRFISKGLRINSLCEDPLCKCKGAIKYYCKICKLHLCLCKTDHINSKEHIKNSKTFFLPEPIVDLDEYFNLQEVQRILEKKEELAKETEESFKKFKGFLDELKKGITDCEKFIEKNEKDFNNIIFIANSLLDTLRNTQYSLNYNIIDNLLKNNIEDLISTQKKSLIKGMNDTFQPIIEKFYSQIEVRTHIRRNTSSNINQPEMPKPKGNIRQMQIIENKHKNGLLCIVLTRNGKLFTGGQENDICVYKPKPEKKSEFAFEKVLKGHTDTVCSMTEPPTGNFFISSSWDKTFRKWNTETYECVLVVQAHPRSVYHISTMKDGRIVSGSSDRTIKVWTSEGKNLATLYGHTEFVYCVLELKDGRLVSGSKDCAVRFWDTKRYFCEEEHTIRDAFCYYSYNGMVYLEKENVLLVGGRGKITVIDLTKYAINKVVRVEYTEAGINSLLCLSDGSFIVGLDTTRNQLQKFNKNLQFEYVVSYEFKNWIYYSILVNNSNKFITSDDGCHLILWEY